MKVCSDCQVDHNKHILEQVTADSKDPLKQGRPVANRELSDEELIYVFKQKLRLGFHKINEKFRTDLSRTDKYRTMLVRHCKRVLAETMGMIGIDSYAKSKQLEKYLPEYEKRFAQMKRLMESYGSGDLMVPSSYDSQSQTKADSSSIVSQCQVYLSFTFYSLYVSKERCLKIAESTGVSNSVANSLISLRDETALKGFQKYSSLNPFFYPFLVFCMNIMKDEMYKFETLSSISTKLIEKDLK